MSIVAVVLMGGALLLTFFYQVCVEDYKRLAGPDRTGAAAGFAIVLLLRWGCIAGVLGICVAKGAFGGPDSRGLQYFLVYLVHTVLGAVSLLSGMLKTGRSSDLADSTVTAMGWVPFLLPAFQAVFALSVLFPDFLEAGSLMPVRVALLGLMGAVGLAAGAMLAISAVREHRRHEARRLEWEKEKAEEKRAESEKRFQSLTPESPLGDWMEFLASNQPEPRRVAVRNAIVQRPSLERELSERILSPDHEAARVAMSFVGEVERPPAGVIEAIRVRVAEVLSVAESISPDVFGSREALYNRAHTLSTGITAAAHGLRRVGVDLRPELRKMAEACGPREKMPPRDIADSCDRVIEHFERLDREAAATK